MRWLSRTLVGLLALGTLGVAFAVASLWLLASEAGTKYVFARVLERTGSLLTVGEVHGSLLGGLDFRDVHLALPRDDLTAARLQLDWDAPAALAGRLAFRTARASPVVYRRLEPNEARGDGGGRSATEVLDLPFAIEVEDAAAESIAMTVGDDTLVLGSTRARARFAKLRLDLEQVMSTARGATLEGNGAVVVGDAIGLEADLAWTGPVVGTDAAGRLVLRGDWPVLHIRHELTAPMSVTVEGDLRFEAELGFTLVATWQNLTIPGVQHVASPSGRLSIDGRVASYRFDGAGKLAFDERLADFTAAGTGEAGLVHFAPLVLAAQYEAGLAGELLGNGDVALDLREATLDVTVTEFDPSWLIAGWPGRLTGVGKLRANLDPEPEAWFESADLVGQIRAYPVMLRGGARVTIPNRWQLDAIRLDSGPNWLTLDGSLELNGPLDLAVTADVTQLDLVLPGFGGAATANLTIAGTFDEPSGRGKLEARGIEYRGVTFGRIALEGEAGLAPETPLAIEIDAEHVTRGAISAETVRGNLQGTTRAHRFSAGAQASDWLAALNADGGLENGLWRGSIRAFEFDELLLGEWRLVEPVNASFGLGTATVETSCLVHQSGARWCAALDIHGRAEDRFVLSAQNFEIESLKPLLPPQLTLDGVYQLSVSFSDLTRDPRGALALTGGTTRARVQFGDQQAFATELDGVRAFATVVGGRLELNANVESGDTGRVAVQASIDNLRAKDSAIGGSIDVQWPDLGFLVLLSPELGQVGGTLAADLAIAGTVDNPELQGHAAWNGGRVAVPAWGLTIDQIEAKATSRDGRALEYDAVGHIGDGTVQLTGSTALDPQAGWPSNLKLRGDSVRAVQLPDIEVFVTPELDIAANLPNVRVTGKVTIPRAKIELSALPDQAVAPSADAIVHGKTTVTEMRPLALSADFELLLGDDVRYTGLNLETKVSGGLRLSVDPTRSMSANGTLTLAGSYNAYGQTLQLERGQLLFSGPLDDPGLDVRATRTIGEDVTNQTNVGVELVGSVKAPRTRVFSTPAMSEADALSYLLLGRPVTTAGAGGAETAALQTAALSMGLQQALPVVQRIGASLGLDELSVQSTTTDAGALMAGKYLSPKVYIRYSYGLFNRIGGLLLRFKVNERLSIETRSGDQKSMDLLYTVEKD